jgi:hypothetical protein
MVSIRGQLAQRIWSRVAVVASLIGILSASVAMPASAPTTLSEAEALAEQDKYEFQNWALRLVKARKAEVKKGADGGIDGKLLVHDDASGKTKQILISVKGGNIALSMVRDLA